jgi:hypothetical protein
MKWLENLKKLQLWTNADRTEYAIFLTGKSDNGSVNKPIMIIM